MESLDKERLESFEKMLDAVQNKYDVAVSKMEQMKAEGRSKTVTYRQLMADKLTYGNILAMYRLYGLIE